MVMSSEFNVKSSKILCQNDPAETLCVQACATYQYPVDIVKRENGRAVVRLYAAPVQNPHLVSKRREEFFQDVANKTVNRQNFIRSGYLAGPNGPDRFISDYEPFCFHSGDVFHPLFELAGEDLFHPAGLAFFNGFSDTQNHVQTGLQTEADLVPHKPVRLAKQVSTFGMTGQNIGTAAVSDLNGRNLSSERPLLGRIHVLRPHGHSGNIAEHSGNLLEHDGRRKDQDLPVLRQISLHFLSQLPGGLDAIGHGLEHLPVGCHQFFHRAAHSSRALKAGSSLPSRNSRKDPPPVERKEKFSSSP